MRSSDRILIVEDDPRTSSLLELYLRDAGFATALAADGRQGLAAARTLQPILVILDLMLPGCDGWSVCRELRRTSDVPILILSARQEEEDRLAGLGLGADDYVVKPFSPREIVLRVRAILRRAYGARHRQPEGPIVLDAPRRSVFAYEEEKALTPSEFKLLEALMETPGRTFERQELLDRLYPAGGSVVPKVVDVHMAKLRRKIEPEPSHPRHIVTVRGFGYRFESEG